MPYIDQNYDARTFLIYIDSYENGVPVGQFYHPYRDELCSFESLTQLLLGVEQNLDTGGPQPIRTFVPTDGAGDNHVQGRRPWAGKLSTFSIHMLFRRNATWQGVCTWLETGQTQQFRSALELIFLMNSALTVAQDPVRLRQAQAKYGRAAR